jgi:hypothetical protein
VQVERGLGFVGIIVILWTVATSYGEEKQQPNNKKHVTKRLLRDFGHNGQCYEHGIAGRDKNHNGGQKQRFMLLASRKCLPIVIV